MFLSLLDVRLIARNGKRSHSDDAIVWVCRLLCLAAAITIALFGIMVRELYPQYHDPAWMRGGMSLLFLGIVFLSYVSTWVRRNIVRICCGSVYPFTAWLLYLCIINAFDANVVIALIITINVSALGIIMELHRLRPLLAYIFFTLASVGVGLLAMPDAQVLSVHFYSLLLINMFVIYLTAEARLSILRQRRQTEERYRAFAATVSEGFFQFIFETPLNPSRATREEITAHLLAHTRLAECNGETCRILGVRYPDEILGASIQDLFGAEAEAPVKHFIHEGFRLTSWNHSWASEDGHVRHFVVNVVSTWEGGELSSVLGSFTEVTEQVEKERRMVSLLEEHEGRIGRDLHDETGQILTSIRMLSSTLARRYFKEGDEGYEQAQQVAKFAREIHDSVQNIYRRLIPHSLESDSLAEALETLAFQTDRLPDLNVHFEQEGDYHFADPGIKLQMYRIAQEAVGNAVKHAGASNITISLCRQDQDVVLEVEDDGRGFDVSAATHRTGAIGIYSMHYRARSIQAALQIDSAPGTGTRVRCCVPQVEMLQTVPHGQ